MNLLHVYVKHSQNSVQFINAFSYSLNWTQVLFISTQWPLVPKMVRPVPPTTKGNRIVFLHYAFITKKSYMLIKPTTGEDWKSETQ